MTRVLGIDPGTATVGWAVLETTPNTPTVIAYGHIETPADEPMPQRLYTIHDDIAHLIEKYRPSDVAVEELFFFKNHKTVITVAESRGVTLLAAQQAHCFIGEYTPLQIKQALTSYGRADKKQMQETVVSVLKLDEIPKPDDTADALAIALCHINTKKFTELTNQ